MTIGCPSFLLAASAATRAIRSLAPPGPNGTTQWMGRSGHSARAADAKTALTKTAAASATPFILFSLDGHPTLIFLPRFSCGLAPEPVGDDLAHYIGQCLTRKRYDRRPAHALGRAGARRNGRGIDHELQRKMREHMGDDAGLAVP